VDLIRNEVQNVKRNAWKNFVQHVIEVEIITCRQIPKTLLLVTLDTDSELDSKSEEDDL
jgi:hypothetical protein